MFKKKKFYILPLCVLLLGTSALPTRATELGDAVQQQKDISNKTSQARGLLNQLTYTADTIKTQLTLLETKIAAAQILLSQKQTAHDRAKQEVLAAKKELEIKQQELEDRQVALGNRAKAIYESGQVSYLELLFQAADLGDFITRVEYFTKLVSNDRQLLMDIQGQKEQIVLKTVELQSKQEQAAQLASEAAAVKGDLDKAKSQQRVALEQTQSAQQAAYDNIEKLEAEANAWNDKIRKLQAAQAARNGGISGSISTWPVPGYYEISSPFGWRTHPITRKRSMHTGTDIVAPSGKQIKAAGAGVVIMAGWNTAYGNMLIIDHGKGISSLYGHMSSIKVSEGQSVQANDLIGLVGSTGWSTGAHLHFEVREGGNPTDPLRFYSR